MIPLTADTPILLATEPADFRSGIDGLAARCQHQLHQDPRSGTLYVGFPDIPCSCRAQHEQEMSGNPKAERDKARERFAKCLALCREVHRICCEECEKLHGAE